MSKTEKVFDMLNLISESPGLTIPELSGLCHVSERGIYRYIHTAEKLGYHLRNTGGHFYRDRADSVLDLTGSVSGTVVVREALALLVAYTNDPQKKKECNKLLKSLDQRYPRKKRGARLQIVKTGQAAEPGGTLTIGHASKPAPINPLTTTNTISANLMELIFSSLVKIDSKQNLVPDLATEWSMSSDGLRWTFHLRHDAVFHDGERLTAHDVVFTYQSMMMTVMATRFSFIDSVSASDNYTVNMVLNTPCPSPYRLAIPIAPAHFLSGGTQPIGSGPFRFKEQTDNSITLVRNQYYYIESRPVLDTLIFREYEHRQDSINAIMSKEVDIALDLLAADLRFAGSDKFKIYAIEDGSYYVLLFNFGRKKMQDLLTRQRLWSAVDTEALRKHQLKSHSRAISGPFISEDFPEVQEAPAKFPSKKLTVKIGILDDTDILKRLGVAIRAQLGKADIEAVVSFPENESEARRADTILCRRHGSNPEWFWTTDGDSNLSSYSNSKVDKLFAEAVVTQERGAKYREIHKIINKDCAAVFIGMGCTYIASRYELPQLESGLDFFHALVGFQITSAASTGSKSKELSFAASAS